MEKKTFVITAGVTAVIVALGLFLLRGALLSENDAEYTFNNGLLADAVTVDGVQYLVPPDEIYDTGVAASDVPALTNPTYTRVTAIDRLLGDDLRGIDVEVDGTHYYYPDQVMNWHQVANVMIGEQALHVVHDPLSGTSVVYEDPGGLENGLSASGKVYNDTLLLDDGHGSLWLASRGVAVSGPRIGEELKQFPSETMTWKVWKELYPDGNVLSAEATGVVRDYTRHPYGDYEATATVYFPLNSTDARLNPKMLVTGLDINGEQLAVSLQVINTTMVVNDTVGGVPLSAFYNWEHDMVHVYSTVVDAQTLTFTYDADKDRFIDDQTGSEWTADGRCQKGTLRGTQLLSINAPEYYWFAWAAVFPDTRVNPTLADAAAVTNE